MNIGAAIKQLRLAKKLTQEELAERAHTSKPNISNLERNAQGFSPVILVSLGKALDVKVSELFQLAEELDESAEGNSTEGQMASVGEPGDSSEELFALIQELSPKKRTALLALIKSWDQNEA